jgi:hypothetical protein
MHVAIADLDSACWSTMPGGSRTRASPPPADLAPVLTLADIAAAAMVK